MAQHCRCNTLSKLIEKRINKKQQRPPREINKRYFKVCKQLYELRINSTKIKLNGKIEIVGEELYNYSCKVEIKHPHNNPAYAEEKKIVSFCIENSHLKAVSAILLLLYSGMRSGELKTIQYVKGEKYDYIDCITEKTRQGLPDVHRHIPISPMLHKVMPYIDFEKAKTAHYRYIDDVFKKIFPTRRLHELRYTFISRCKEFRCSLELVMLWSGHTDDKEVESSKVNRGYTTYSDDFYFKEIELVNYEL